MTKSDSACNIHRLSQLVNVLLAPNIAGVGGLFWLRFFAEQALPFP